MNYLKIYFLKKNSISQFPGWPYPISAAFHSTASCSKDKFSSELFPTGNLIDPSPSSEEGSGSGIGSSSHHHQNQSSIFASNPIFFPSQFMLPKGTPGASIGDTESTSEAAKCSNIIGEDKKFAAAAAAEKTSASSSSGDVDGEIVVDSNDIKIEVVDVRENLENKSEHLNGTDKVPWDIAACDGPVKFHRIPNPILQEDPEAKADSSSRQEPPGCLSLIHI